MLTTLTKLSELALHAPDGGRDLSFLADRTSLIKLTLHGCTELSDLSALASAASQLRFLQLFAAHHVRDLSVLTRLPHLVTLTIGDAPLADGVATVAPVLDRVESLVMWSVPTATSLDALAGSRLQHIDLANLPMTDLAPLATLQSLKRVWRRNFPVIDLAPLATLPHLRELHLTNIDESVDLSPLARTDHRLRVDLLSTSTVGAAGPLVKIRRR